MAAHHLTPERLVERRSTLRGTCLKIPKNRKARRVCDITGMLEQWPQEAFDTSHTGHIIERNGKAVRDIQTEFKAMCQSLHLVDFPFHDLSSTWVAGAALDGVPMEKVRDALGYSTVKITEQH